MMVRIILFCGRTLKQCFDIFSLCQMVLVGDDYRHGDAVY